MYGLINIKEVKKSSIFKPYHSKTFLSTSLIRIRAREEENEIMIKLHVFPKTNSVPLDGLSGSYWEQEFLVNVNAKIWPKFLVSFM